MTGTIRGVVSGAILGVASVVLGQQLGYVDLGPSLGWVYLAVGGVIGALVFGSVGRQLGKPGPRAGVQAWSSSTDPPVDERSSKTTGRG